MRSRAWIGWTVSVFIVIAVLGMAKIGVSQEKQDKKSYELTENQRLRLEVQQSRFALAQEHFQQAVAAFNGEVKAVEKENGWPEDSVQFDPNTLSFHEVSKPPATPAKEHEKPATKNP
jgi:hypothetical protein